MCLATAHAILPLRTGYYETFLITHIALVILTLVTCWYNLVPHFGFVYGYQVWLYICFALWFFDRFVRVVCLVYYNRLGSSMAIMEALPGCDVLQVTVFPRVWSFGPGQHSFLYLPDSSLYLPGLGAKLWENHLFSVAGWKRQGDSSIVASSPASRSHSTAKGEKLEDPNIISVAADLEQSPSPAARQQPITLHQTQIQDYTSIQFLIRVHSGITTTLQRRVLASPSHWVEVAMYTEGPYAGNKATLQSFYNADTILLLIGGIGITTALGFV